MRKVGAKSLPKWAVFVLIAVVIVGLIVYFELSYGFMFGDNGIFKPASEKNLKEFSTAVFDDLEVRRDGKEKSISVTGIPMGATVTYSPQKSFREAGTYEITATIEMEGYKTKTMTAKLTIYDTYTVSFVQSRISRRTIVYVRTGETLDPNDIPDLVQISGYTVSWSDFNLTITEDVEIQAVYTEIKD